MRLVRQKAPNISEFALFSFLALALLLLLIGLAVSVTFLRQCSSKYAIELFLLQCW